MLKFVDIDLKKVEVGANGTHGRHDEPHFPVNITLGLSCTAFLAGVTIRASLFFRALG